MSEWQQNHTYPLFISLWDDQGLKDPEEKHMHTKTQNIHPADWCTVYSITLRTSELSKITMYTLYQSK